MAVAVERLAGFVKQVGSATQRHGLAVGNVGVPLTKDLDHIAQADGGQLDGPLVASLILPPLGVLQRP